MYDDTITNAYYEGYQEVVENLKLIAKRYHETYRKNRHELKIKMQNEDFIVSTVCTQMLDENFIEQSNDLGLSTLIRYIPSAPNPDEKFKSELQAKQSGILNALKKIKELIQSSEEFIKTQEDYNKLRFLKDVYNELLSQNLIDIHNSSLSFNGWKQRHHCGWFLISSEQEERYFDEYCDFLKANGLHYDDFNNLYELKL